MLAIEYSCGDAENRKLHLTSCTDEATSCTTVPPSRESPKASLQSNVMSFRTLNDLPAETLARICEYVSDSHRPTLRDLALANKRLHAAAAIYLFRTIRFLVQYPQRLQQDVQECIDILQRNSSLRNVRCMVLVGQMRSSQEEGHQRENLSTESKIKSFFEQQDDEDYGAGYGAEFEAGDKSPTIVYEENRHWQPIADLARQLPGLTDIFYSCSDQFPPCLLDALHATSPISRLHTSTFKLRSLHDDFLDHHEHRLITSPCLSTIRVKYDPMYDSDGIEDYNEDALVRIIRGVAPKLRAVYAYPKGAPASLPLERAMKTPRKPWKGFSFESETVSSPVGSLRYLRLGLVGDPSIQFAKALSACTDFDMLHTLELERGNDESALEHLVTCRFPSLVSFSLRFQMDNYNESCSEQYSETANTILRALPGLSRLKVSGAIRRANFDTIMDCHGRTLRTLSITTCRRPGWLRISRAEATQLSKSCPRLDELKLRITRSLGDKAEVAIYRRLGKIATLRSLSLTLDVSQTELFPDSDDGADEPPTPPNDPAFDDFDQKIYDVSDYAFLKPRVGHVRRALMNSALDEALCRAIFQSISSAKPERSVLLDQLKLHIEGGGNFGHASAGISQITEEISHDWLVTRSPRDSSRHMLHVDDLGPVDKSWSKPGESLPPKLGSIYRKIWPSKLADDDWRNDWHSWPLSLG